MHNQYIDNTIVELKTQERKRMAKDEHLSKEGDTIISVDPGLSGAISVIRRTDKGYELVATSMMPIIYLKSNESPALTKKVDTKKVFNILQDYSQYTDKILIEFQKGYDGQKTQAIFSLGAYTESVKAAACILGLKIGWIIPGVWKEALNIKAKKNYSSRIFDSFQNYIYNEVSNYIDNITIEDCTMYNDYFCQNEISDGLCESMLIGVYALKSGFDDYSIY